MGFNLAVFDQTLEGFQDFLFTGTGFQLSNAGEQSVRGFEFDTTINPVDPLVVTFALTYLDPLFDSFVESPIGRSVRLASGKYSRIRDRDRGQLRARVRRERKQAARSGRL